MAEATIYQIPSTGFLNLRQILGDKRCNPPIQPIIPVGRTTWFARMKTGQYPQGVRLGARTLVFPLKISAP
jgi:prophage regulatory protein